MVGEDAYCIDVLTAEFIGGPLMIILLEVVFRLFLRERLLKSAKSQSEKGLAGSMEGHAARTIAQQAAENSQRWREPTQLSKAPRRLHPARG
jgi:hypothetical protein